MQLSRNLTAVISKEGDLFVALCPELDVASQGESVEAAKAKLTEAVELFLETADESEIVSRLQNEVHISQLELKVG